MSREKLVRDKIRPPGRYRVARTVERAPLLLAKLREETDELARELERPTPGVGAVREELADVLEVVYGLMSLLGFDAVNEINERKRAISGAFEDFIVLRLED